MIRRGNGDGNVEGGFVGEGEEGEEEEDKEEGGACVMVKLTNGTRTRAELELN